MANKKVYIVRKYIVANTLAEAVRKEKKQSPDDVWMEDSSTKNYIENISKEDNKTGYDK